MRYSSLLIVILMPVLAFAAAGQETRDLELSAGGIDTLQVQCSAGYLVIRGIEGLDKIDVTADILVEGLDGNDLQPFFNNNILFDLRKRGTRAVLRAEILRSSRFKPNQAKLDLLVLIPRKMKVRIDDGSGPIDVSDVVGNFQIDDNSGNIKLRKIMGNVSIRDTSGPIELEDIKGNVDVRDGSGSININFIIGDVSVVDASGSIKIQDVEGNVKVMDGSGSIEVHDISESVSILESDSGEISVEGIKGKITRRDIDNPKENVISDDVE